MFTGRFIIYKYCFILGVSSDIFSDDNSDLDPTFVLHDQDSCSDGSHLSRSDTEDNFSNIDDRQNNNDFSVSDGPDSDWEDSRTPMIILQNLALT